VAATRDKSSMGGVFMRSALAARSPTGPPLDHQHPEGEDVEPRIASMIRPGNKIHCQASTMNSKIAVTKSTAHCTGGVSVKKTESPSASAAT